MFEVERQLENSMMEQLQPIAGEEVDVVAEKVAVARFRRPETKEQLRASPIRLASNLHQPEMVCIGGRPN